MKIQKKTLDLLKSLLEVNKDFTKKEILEITGAKSSTVNSLVHRGFLEPIDDKVESTSENGRKSQVKQYRLSEGIAEELKNLAQPE
jgi:hypothetical protein